MTLSSKIGLGSVQFGIPYGVSNQTGQTAPEEVSRILDCASRHGISYIDTASAYGTSEEVLGRNDLGRFRIVTKFMPQEGNNNLSAQLEQSLSRLNIGSVYGYLAHRPLDVHEHPAQWDELLKLKSEGKVQKIGFSLNKPEELELLTEDGMFPDLVQVPFNYFDHRFKKQLVDLKARGCEVHTRSAFLQGLFFMEQDQLPVFFDDVKDEIRSLQQTYRNELSSALLKYVLSQDFIDVAVMGVENEAQLKANLSSIASSPLLPERNFEFSESLMMPGNWPK